LAEYSTESAKYRLATSVKTILYYLQHFVENQQKAALTDGLLRLYHPQNKKDTLIILFFLLFARTAHVASLFN